MLSLFKINKMLLLTLCTVFASGSKANESFEQDCSQYGQSYKQQGLKIVDITPELKALYAKVKDTAGDKFGEDVFCNYSLSFIFATMLNLTYLISFISYKDRREKPTFTPEDCIVFSPFCYPIILSLLTLFLFHWRTSSNQKKYTLFFNKEFSENLTAFVKQIFAKQQSGACINSQNEAVTALLNWILCVDTPCELRPKLFAQRLAAISSSQAFSNAMVAALKAKQ